MKYYKVMFDSENENTDDIVCTAPSNLFEMRNIKKNAIYIGLELDLDSNTTFTFKSTEGSNPTDYLANNLMWPIFSWRAMTIINEISSNEVQILPVRIIDTEFDQELKGYSILNVLELSDALDLENSIYSVLEAKGKEMLSIQKMAIKEDNLKGRHIVRVKDNKFALIVSEVIRGAMVSHKLTGIDFLEIKVT